MNIGVSEDIVALMRQYVYVLLSDMMVVIAMVLDVGQDAVAVG